MYHQKCHFVPLLVLPRGSWQCMVCQTSQQQHESSKKKRAHTDTEQQQQQRFFQSPPDTSMQQLEQQWEADTATVKAKLWKQQFHYLKQSCQTQITSFRQASTTLDALTLTQRNRQYFLNNIQTAVSQELSQTLVKLFGSQYTIRKTLLNLEAIRTSTDASFRILQAFCQDQKETSDFVQRVIFPFGSSWMQHYRRTIPRTPEMPREKTLQDNTLLVVSSLPGAVAETKNTATAIIPKEISLAEAAAKDKRTSRGGSNNQKKNGSSPTRKSHAKHHHNHGDDDDSGISLDDLQCCICLQSDATDDNDLLLCDGCGCYRAYHQACVSPVVANVDDDDDWFCPICVNIADLIVLVQEGFMGDEWEQRRYAMYIEEQAITTESLKSWAAVEQVFPESQWQYETACLLNSGTRNSDTRRLLALVLGEEDDELNGLEDDKHGQESNEDEEDEEDFDPDKVEEKAGDADDESISSSKASLEDLSSVELNIRAEVAALSEADSSYSESEPGNGNETRRRKSRRLRKLATSTENSCATSLSDQGKIDTANIVYRKRSRKSVDYIKLNEAMFGDVSGAGLKVIDDADEYEATRRKKNGSDNESSSDSDSSNESSSSGSPDDDEDNSSESRSKSGKKSSTSKTASNRRATQPTKDDRSSRQKRKNAKAIDSRTTAKDKAGSCKNGKSAESTRTKQESRQGSQNSRESKTTCKPTSKTMQNGRSPATAARKMSSKHETQAQSRPKRNTSTSKDEELNQSSKRTKRSGSLNGHKSKSASVERPSNRGTSQQSQQNDRAATRAPRRST